MADISKAARLVLGMGAMARLEATAVNSREVYELHNWRFSTLEAEPSMGRRRKVRKETEEDRKAYNKKVEKRRKKNKNKKTHRR